MGERKLDRSLGIRTVGIREWRESNVQYNRYEATPYKVLEVLCENYKFKDAYRVVDFGCGRGRVAFYLHNRLQIPVVGIEANPLTYEEALENKALYRLKAQDIPAPIRFKYGLAQHFKIDEKDNCFYFFNPFSVQIFRKVVHNIMRSVAKHRRTVDLILYYPVREYKDFLRTTPFEMINKIRVPDAHDKKEKILIYRLREEIFDEEDDIVNFG